MYNPRKELKPGDTEYEKINKSLNEFGLVDPLIVNKDMTVIGGHQRLSVLKDAGFNKVPCSVVDLDKTKEKALNIALNKITGEWDFPKLNDLLIELDTGDFDMEAVGYSEDELKELLGYVPGGEFPELPDGDKEPFQQMTFTLHDTQAEQVSEALKTSKAMGPFIDSDNENSNGNALARICETFLTGHGNS